MRREKQGFGKTLRMRAILQHARFAGQDASSFAMADGAVLVFSLGRFTT
jgi:hypothetical protein